MSKMLEHSVEKALRKSNLLTTQILLARNVVDSLLDMWILWQDFTTWVLAMAMYGFKIRSIFSQLHILARTPHPHMGWCYVYHFKATWHIAFSMWLWLLHPPSGNKPIFPGTTSNVPNLWAASNNYCFSKVNLPQICCLVSPQIWNISQK